MALIEISGYYFLGIIAALLIAGSAILAYEYGKSKAQRSTRDETSPVPSDSKGEPTIDAVSTESREAILAITDKILKLIPQGIEISARENAEIERLLNQLTWHLGMWKSYGSQDTAKRVQAALRLIAQLTAMGSPDKWSEIRYLIVSVFQSINGMALVLDENLTPLLLRRFHEQIEAKSKALGKERERHAKVSEIINQMIMANNLFQERRKAELFRLDKAGIVERLHSPCASADDFAGDVASLASLFEVPLDPLRVLVPKAQTEWKSITLVEKMLESEKVRFDSDMIKTWQNIVNLRNAIPLHPRDQPIQALEFFGASFPVDYEQLWSNVLDRFLESLKKFVELLAGLSKK